MPTEAPLCPPPGEDPNDWVDCDNGYVRGTDELCADACGDDCCEGKDACDKTTACIKKDGSCSGDFACDHAGYYSSYGLRISGPSCVGSQSCRTIFEYNYGMGVVSLTNSCLCHEACYSYMYPATRQYHCGGSDGNPAPLPGLPSCGEPLNNVSGFSGSICAVRFLMLLSLCALSFAYLQTLLDSLLTPTLLHCPHCKKRRSNRTLPFALLLVKIRRTGSIAWKAESGGPIRHALLYAATSAARETSHVLTPQLASRRMGAATDSMPAFMQVTEASIIYRYLAHPALLMEHALECLVSIQMPEEWSA